MKNCVPVTHSAKEESLKEKAVRSYQTSHPARVVALAAAFLALALAGCTKAAPPAPAAQAMPVMVAPVTLGNIPTSDSYVATIKSRRSATMQPQVDGNLVAINVKSGDAVKAGQLLMRIDPLKQVATVQSQQGTEAQKKAVYGYNEIEVERQRKLFEAGVTSRDAYDQALQAYQNSKGDLDSASALTGTQKAQLAYYEIRAPFAGIVGDVPVHLGDYVSATTVLTTVDENSQLEAYIYIPTEQSTQVRMGLPVDILDTAGTVLASTKIDFVSPQVDNDLQSILAKADVTHSSQKLRTAQIVRARITWSTAPGPTVPVLAVTRVGGQTFVYVAAAKGGGYSAHQIAVTLGEPLGNIYPVLAGLKPGDRVITSGIQFLQEGAPVSPITGGPPAAAAPAAGN